MAARSSVLIRAAVRDHTRLRAFELADSLALAVYRHTLAFPRDELFALTAQLRRGAVSIPSNIVEGCARSSQGDYLRFLDIAFASAREVEYQLSLARRLGYLDEAAHGELASLAAETGRVLAGLIRALRAGRPTAKPTVGSNLAANVPTQKPQA